MTGEKTMIFRNIPETLRRELKIQAAKEGRSMNEIILTLIREYLEGKK